MTDVTVICDSIICMKVKLNVDNTSKLVLQVSLYSTKLMLLCKLIFYISHVYIKQNCYFNTVSLSSQLQK